MALTPAQLTTLATDIAGDPALSAQPLNDDGHFAIAAAYNLPASPAFTVWRTNVPTSDVKKSVVWTEYISATSDAERAALNLIISNGIVNASDANVRQGFLTIFGGPQQAATRANLTAISKRLATRAEKLFATGTGTDAAPATMTFEGTLSYQDVSQARNS